MDDRAYRCGSSAVPVANRQNLSTLCCFIDDKMPVARCGQHHFQHPGEKRFLLVKGFDLPARQSDIHADNLQICFLDIKIFTQQHVSCAYQT
ncbi:hypothetical protein LNQ03_06485 [Klebsiella pneumoniae subsp. pneumoniae]|nr:hypothetical protein [Klebsiella pneumoniae subsp. pneumoniae]